MKTTTKEYKKHNSFVQFSSNFKKKLDSTLLRINKILNDPTYLNHVEKKYSSLVASIENDLFLKKDKNKSRAFSLSQHVIDEISTLENEEILKYLIHRYRYEIFPEKQILDDYPPYLQIEPSSICNYRCVFCFETDKTFTNKKNGFMGTMKLELFKDIIDQAENNVEFISIASRGEPLVSRDIDKMFEYTTGKFLNLKINTNASLLNEKAIHAILSGGVKTVVFSADAADKELYAKLRVNGNLDTILRNIENFNKIKETKYPNKKIITRVSGVKVDNNQDIDSMQNLWKNLVDQVAFVDYNPWENVYGREHNSVIKPCSDLWRRMFIWWDGKINPCDTDYKSVLSVGNFKELGISKSWKSETYQIYRDSHKTGNRKALTPCKSCVVT